MSSKKTAGSDVDFARDVPTTAEDIEALWRARQLPPLTDEQYLEWVALVGGHRLPRGNSVTDEPFEL